jgi:hypothetical protein
MTDPLRLAYLIFVHKDPKQLARLVSKLYCPTCMFYIYVDGKADINQFRRATNVIPSGNIVWITKRKPICWGNFSLTDAYLSSFQTILQQRPEPDFILTISGQDYPIATNETIHNWLAQYAGCTILDHSVVTNDATHILERVEQYYLSVKRHHAVIYPHPNPTSARRKFFNAALRLSGLYPMPRRMPLDHQLYFGTNWFQLKPVAAQYLIDFSNANPAYLNFFRTTYVPEEVFFQTVLLNASVSDRGEIHNQRLTYMQWDRPPGSYTSPILANEVPSMLTSGKFFARKFDNEYGDEVLYQIDLHLNQLNLS